MPKTQSDAKNTTKKPSKLKNTVKRKRVKIKKLAKTTVESKNSWHKCGFRANHAVFGFTNRAPKNAAF